MLCLPCAQVCYGVTIVSFLGAVHWGLAMGSALTGPLAARIAAEVSGRGDACRCTGHLHSHLLPQPACHLLRSAQCLTLLLPRCTAAQGYAYSVIPALVAWPVALMEPGPGAIVLSLLLPACYLADVSRRTYLPAWYMALRLPLTLAATFGTLLTATRHLHEQLDAAQSSMAGLSSAAVPSKSTSDGSSGASAR